MAFLHCLFADSHLFSMPLLINSRFRTLLLFKLPRYHIFQESISIKKTIQMFEIHLFQSVEIHPQGAIPELSDIMRKGYLRFLRILDEFGF